MKLSAAFFEEVVRSRADERLGTDAYSAGLFGQGSEVLGLDTPMSADHDWGPRVVLFVAPEALAEAEALAAELPSAFQGVSCRFGAAAGGSAWVQPFEITTVPAFFGAWVGFHDAGGASVLRWLATPSMSFLAVAAGATFHDGTGRLAAAQETADWYPDDLWRWLLACQWRRIGEEQPFIERASRLGDALGASVVAARVVRDAMRLAFLLERRYAPYGKWLGTAFRRLDRIGSLAEQLGRSLRTGGDAGALNDALEALAAATDATFGLGVDPSRRPFHDRPFEVAPAEELTEALVGSLASSPVEQLPTHVGNVDMLFGTNNGSFPGAEDVYRGLLGEG